MDDLGEVALVAEADPQVLDPQQVLLGVGSGGRRCDLGGSGAHRLDPSFEALL